VIDLDRAFDFTGKTAVVIGGSGVLCGTLAEALGRQRAAVVVVGHSRIKQAEQVAEAITSQGGRAVAVTADVLDRRSLEDLARHTIETYGGVDILVNGAGGAKPEATTSQDLSFFDLPEEAVRWVFDLNFMGTFLACQVFGRHMVGQDRGTVLNIASAGADRPLTRSVAYSAAKAAVVNFTKWLAVHVSQEYSPHIRVNALMPGFFLTVQNRFLLLDEHSGELTERGRRIIDHTPMGRFGQPDDLIGPALLLLSEAASFMHGTTLTVDGGISVYGGV
jgi:NAD(P)-dependent dehydrogenase (short-subunit alcohol dehydrogenase family)